MKIHPNIPKKIFTFWHSEIIPDVVCACIASWKRYNPDYEIIVFNQNSFKIEHKNEIMPNNLYSLIYPNQADYVRLYLVEKYGGFWLDASIIITGSLDSYLNNENVTGFGACWYPQCLENWFFCAPQNHILIREWKNEYVKAINMGIDKYKLYFLQNLDKLNDEGKINKQMKTQIIDVLVHHLPYLTVFACFIFINHEKQLFANLTNSREGPVKCWVDNNWNVKNCINILLQKALNEIYNNDIYAGKIIKFFVNFRNCLIEMMQNISNVKPESVIDKYLLPYYNNPIIIRTHDPTEKTIERIKRLCTEIFDKRIIISLNISLDSFVKIDNTDILGHDIQSFKNEKTLLKNLPNMLYNKNIAFVKFNNVFYYKTFSDHNILTIKKNTSRKINRTLYYLKPNICKLLETFNSKTIHIYTEIDMVEKFGRENMKNIETHNLAYNYYNEAIALAIESDKAINKNNINMLWILEDELEYTGNLNTFLTDYDNKKMDLITFKDFIENPNFEFIVGMSGAFVREMLKLLNNGYNSYNGYNGYNGYSEYSTINYCLQMKHGIIENKYHSKQLNYHLENAFNNNEDVEKYVDKLRQNRESQFVHPCKF